jgi:hypothetical protein
MFWFNLWKTVEIWRVGIIICDNVYHKISPPESGGPHRFDQIRVNRINKGDQVASNAAITPCTQVRIA